jgi:chromate transport protein ChrA
VTAGVLGAIMTTWVTFVPSMLWIFAGAPFIEPLRANRRLSGALAAITAAVVGVILNLSVWFALHVLFGHVTERHFGWLRWYAFDPLGLDLKATALAVIAAVLAFGFPSRADRGRRGDGGAGDRHAAHSRRLKRRALQKFNRFRRFQPPAANCRIAEPVLRVRPGATTFLARRHPCGSFSSMSS